MVVYHLVPSFLGIITLNKIGDIIGIGSDANTGKVHKADNSAYQNLSDPLILNLTPQPL